MQLNSSIAKYQNKLNALCEEYKVKKFYAFGSSIRDDFKFYSDADFLVEFKGEDDNSLVSERFIWFKRELAYVLKRPVDLILLKSAMKSKLRMEIKEEKYLIWGKD